MAQPEGAAPRSLAMRDGVDLAVALADENSWKSAVQSYEAAVCERVGVAAKQAMAVLVEGTSEDSIESIEKMMT